jgi:UDP-glucose 4-epimerase
VVARLSNGFGYPMDDAVQRWTLVFNDLCLQAVSSGRLVLQTPGYQERDFIPLGDVAGAIAHLLALPAGALGDALFNLGSGRSLSIRGAAELVAARLRVTRDREVVVEAPAPPAGSTPQAHTRFEIGKLLNTGFSPSADWDREVDGTLDVAERVAAMAAGR